MKSPKPLKRLASPRKRNPQRKKREFARCYGSKERVEWVKSQPCVACNLYGFSENAHVKAGGSGYKAGYADIVPLCGANCGGIFRNGCHRMLHQWGRPKFENWFQVNLEERAVDTEAAWLSHLDREQK